MNWLTKGKWNNKKPITQLTKKMINTNEILVLKTQMLSSYNEGCKNEAVKVIWYYLAKEIDGAYFELFSKLKIETENDNEYDTPEIVEVKLISEYFETIQNEIEASTLMRFITNMNIQQTLDSNLE